MIDLRPYEKLHTIQMLKDVIRKWWRVELAFTDAKGYVLDHELRSHPLADRGYPSIGCWPCTRPVADGEDPRAGRWAGTDTT